MTAQVLSTELTNIIQETKRKNTELRNTAEKSLQDLKAITVTSEAQLAGDLRRRPHFITPFVLAGKSGNAKLALHGITAFQRLIASRGLPVERLKEVLQSLQESCKAGLDVQLKILQSLPQLIQLYGDVLEGELQATVLQVCCTLQQVKAAVISSTASATFQQIVTLLFEKVEQEDDRAGEIPAVAELKLDGQMCFVRPAAHDAYRVLQDICLLIEGQKARFIPNASLSQGFGLSLLEALLNNHGDLFLIHTELAQILRAQVMPLITRILSERQNFAITVRICRILCILLREHLDTVSVECEIPLSLLHHSLDGDTSSSGAWRRALTMEVYRIVYSTPNLAMQLYALLDERSGRGNIIQDSLGTFVRLASEKPALIGLGPQSTFPSGSSSAKSTADRALLEASSVAGIITTGDLAVPETAAPGISTQWSTMTLSCLDQVDKSDAASIPETYVYSLILACLNGLSDSMARVILPMGSSMRLRKNNTLPPGSAIIADEENLEAADGTASNSEALASGGPGNPEHHEDDNASAVRTISHIVENCWPAILATSSTFLYAALDADFYRTLIRSFQRFTQVAGLLELSTPRDAFLTTLSKAAVPANVMKAEIPSGTTSPRIASNSSAFASVESFLAQVTAESPSTTRHHNFESSLPYLSQRNLMCLRALINLAIALGAILESSWNIILQNLQRADAILAQSSGVMATRDTRQTDSTSGKTSLGSEITALESAISRLFQSTAAYSDEAFLVFLNALCGLLPMVNSGHPLETPPGTPGKLQRTGSTIGQASALPSSPRSVHFILAKLGDVARINISRFAQIAESSAWRTLADSLMRICTSPDFESTSRLMAADVLGNIAVGLIVAIIEEEETHRGAVQLRALDCLDTQISRMYHLLGIERLEPSATDLEVHRAALEALHALLEQGGDSVIAGWKTIFSIIQSAFNSIDDVDGQGISSESAVDNDHAHCARPVSPKISRSAFASVQLICSDFLPSLRKSRVVDLVEIMSAFCSEHIDLNVSLTTISLFWEVSDFLRQDMDEPDVPTGTARRSAEVHRLAMQDAATGSFAATWLVLLCKLAAITRDTRADMRSGAIQTVLRILESCGDGLTPQLWQLCFYGVLLEIIHINLEGHQTRMPIADPSSLSSTSAVIFAGLSSTMMRELRTIKLMPDFVLIWSTIYNVFAAYVSLKSSNIDQMLFQALSDFWAGLPTQEAIGESNVDVAFRFWIENVPTQTNDESNDRAIIAYMNMLRELSRLQDVSKKADLLLDIVGNLKLCVLGTRPGKYANDVDTMVEAHAMVLRSIDSLGVEEPSVVSKLVETLAVFITLPYENSETISNQRLSYIAFSKACILLLESICSKHIKQRALYESGVLATAMKALKMSIKLKYKWTKQGKMPYMWRIATTCADNLIPKVVTTTKTAQINKEVLPVLLEQCATIAIAIAEADLSTNLDHKLLLTDETSDLIALNTILAALTGRESSKARSNTTQHGVATNIDLLASPAVTAATRISYIIELAKTSLIHDPASAISCSTCSDIEALPPLERIHVVRPGRTYNPAFCTRLRMSYRCVDELAAMVNCTDMKDPKSPKDEVPTPIVAQTAFPYFVLRLALPMQRYIADQPLRGRMPTPQSQRLELLYMLRLAEKLECTVGVDVSDSKPRVSDATAQYETNGPVRSRPKGLVQRIPYKRHLEWLLPLVSKVASLARHDREIADACAAVVDTAW